MDIRNFFGGGGSAKGKNAAAAPAKSTKSPSSTNVLKSDKETKPVEVVKNESKDDKSKKANETKSENNNTRKSVTSPSKSEPDGSSKNQKQEQKKPTTKKPSSKGQKVGQKRKVKDDFINDDDDGDEDEMIVCDDEDFAVTRNKKENQQKTPESQETKPNLLKSLAGIVSDEAEEEISPVKRKRKVASGEEKEEKKGKSAASRKRKKEELQENDTDDEEIRRVKKKPSKKKVEQKSTVIYDSGSDEDPLPEKLRKKSPTRRKSKLQPDDSTQSITSAFSKAADKQSQQLPQQSPAATSKPAAARQQISADDFFGSAPVHRLDNREPPKQASMTQKNEAKTESDPRPAASLAEKLAEKKQKQESDQLMNNGRPATAIKQETKQSPHKQASPAKEKNATPPKTSPQMSSQKTTPQKSPSKATPQKSPQKTTPQKSPQKTTPQKSPQKTAVTKSAKCADDSISSPIPPSVEKAPLKSRNSGYFAFKHREPPQSLGAKQLPEGAENCLEGMVFVMTGVLESFERDEVKSAIERLGGKVTTNVSKNTKYLLVGRDAGESKITKALQLSTTQLDEDGLIDLIQKLPGKKSKYEIAAEKEAAANKKKSQSITPSRASSQSFPASIPSSHSQSPLSSKKTTPGSSQISDNFITPSTSQGSQWSLSSTQKTESPDVSSNLAAAPGESLMWVDKYKPAALKQIIGQQGDKSNANKLLHWLKNWHKNLGKKPIFGRPSDDGSGYKAALLSGPPGVGKTTTAQLVCMEAHFSFVELNASDTRSKRSLQEEVSESLNNHTLVDFFGKKKTSSVDGQTHCLVMDEVDGMAGNEDRGGMQELIQLIKNSKIPVICMCNDRNNPKIRSLSNYCFDLRFQRPRVEQIKAAMMSLAYKEGLKIPPAAMNDIIVAANQDIRQVIHNLSMWTAKDKSLTYEQLKSDAAKAQKDLHFGPFDVCRKVFAGGEETARMTLIDKSDLFFHDYSIGPLFVQENYASVTPFSAKGNVLSHLKCLSRAADSIAIGDVFDAGVRKGGNWSLLPTQAIFASVIPGESMRGSMGGMIQFPSWLGKNSTTGKNSRLIQELGNHMCLNVSASKRSLTMDYLPALKTGLTQPLISEGGEGVGRVVDLMNLYDLLREDFDNILELTNWPGANDPLSQLDSKVKAAFTRAYNKESHMTPYATGVAAKKGRRGGGGGVEEELELLEGGEEGEIEEQDETEEDLSKDTMIKQKKAPAKNSKQAADAAGTSGQSKGKSSAKNPTPKNTTKRGGKKS